MNGALQSLKKQAERIKHAYYRDKTIQEILRYNAMAVGIGNYWSMTSAVSQCGSRVDHKLWYKIDKIFRKITGSKLGEISEEENRSRENQQSSSKTCGTQNAHICPGISKGASSDHTRRFQYFSIHRCLKAQKGHALSKEGRAMWGERTAKILRKMRPDDITMPDDLTIWTLESKQSGASMEKRNFEYFINRGYALNRDKCRCKVCATQLLRGNLHTHHKNPFLPIDQINKVGNLASLCTRCHSFVHNDKPNPFGIRTKPHKKLEAYRNEVKPVSS